MSHSGSISKEPSPPATLAAPHTHAAEPQEPGSHGHEGAHSAVGISSSSSHVGELSEARLDEVASRLVADALARAVQKRYAEKIGDTGRQVCCTCKGC